MAPHSHQNAPYPGVHYIEVFLAGGRSAIASLLLTKTLAIGGVTRPDQSGVPASNTLTPMVHPSQLFVSMVFSS